MDASTGRGTAAGLKLKVGHVAAGWGLSAATIRLLVFAVLFASGFLVAALIFWLGAEAPTQAANADQRSVFDQVDECDMLAAHPADPQRTADGVADDAIVPRLAILACDAALKRQPREARFGFQLARAQLAAGNHQDAFTLFSRVAGPLLTSATAKPDEGKSYAAAHGYLGDAYLMGHGVKADVDKATQHYASAVAGKFEPAKKQMEVTRFNPAQYQYGSMLDALTQNQFDKVKAKAGEAPFRGYLHNMVLKLVDECEPFLEPKSLLGLFYFRYPSGWSPDKEGAETDVAIRTAIGEVDAEQFVKRYGCEGPVAKQMFAGMNGFFGLY